MRSGKRWGKRGVLEGDRPGFRAAGVLLGGMMGAMMGVPTMAARSVQISLDAQLLKEVDRQPIAKHEGRSAFIRRAIETYIELQR